MVLFQIVSAGLLPLFTEDAIYRKWNYKRTKGTADDFVSCSYMPSHPHTCYNVFIGKRKNHAR